MLHKNEILAALSPAVYGRLEPYLQPVTLKLGEILRRADEPITHLYFPINCLLSVTLTMQDGASAEVGMVGRREVLGINALMGSYESTQTEYVVQIAGDAVKIEAQILRQEFERNGELRDLLLRCAQAFLAQVSQTAACNALHTLEQRLPRWLLEAQVRVQSQHLALTQEFIAIMLGVRRSGVTQAAQRLQERKIIQYRRGNVQILDQDGLEASACECFRAIQTQYDRLLETSGNTSFKK